jgi:hypothetical protein
MNGSSPTIQQVDFINPLFHKEEERKAEPEREKRKILEFLMAEEAGGSGSTYVD